MIIEGRIPVAAISMHVVRRSYSQDMEVVVSKVRIPTLDAWVDVFYNVQLPDGGGIQRIEGFDLWRVLQDI